MTHIDLGTLENSQISFQGDLHPNGPLRSFSHSVTALTPLRTARVLPVSQRPVRKGNATPGLCAVAFLLVGLNAQALAQQYTVVDLGTFEGGSSYPQAINEAGAVVGFSYNAEGFQRAFLYTTSLTDLGTLGGPGSVAAGLNDLLQVVGAGDTRNPRKLENHAFVYKGVRFPRMSDLGTLGGSVSSAIGINNRGDICGLSLLADNTTNHAFLLPRGTSTLLDLGTLGGNFSSAYGINDSGTVVGVSSTSSGTNHGFVYKNGTLTDIGTLPGSSEFSYLARINGRGVAVGAAVAANGRVHPVTYDGTLHDLTPSFRVDAYGEAISPSGVVVGSVVVDPLNGTTRAVIFQDGQAIDLNTLIPAGTGLTLLGASGINSRGQIIVLAQLGSAFRAIRLDPIPAAPGR